MNLEECNKNSVPFPVHTCPLCRSAEVGGVAPPDSCRNAKLCCVIHDVISVARFVFPKCMTAGQEPTFSSGANQAIDLIESTFRNRGVLP